MRLTLFRFLASLLFFSPLLTQAGTMKVYLGTQGRGLSKGIYLCNLDSETGRLSKPKLAAEISGAGFLALHPNGKYLYSTARGEGNQVAAFQIGKDYMLNPINLQPSEGSGP